MATRKLSAKSFFSGLNEEESGPKKFSKETLKVEKMSPKIPHKQMMLEETLVGKTKTPEMSEEDKRKMADFARKNQQQKYLVDEFREMPEENHGNTEPMQADEATPHKKTFAKEFFKDVE